jgi:hypothetical protein
MRRKFVLSIAFILAGALAADFIFAAEKIDINSAPLEDLIKIIHIGQARATELISLRPFSSLDDLTRIKGIGQARLEDIKEQGLAWAGPSGPQQPSPGLDENGNTVKVIKEKPAEIILPQAEAAALTNPLSSPSEEQEPASLAIFMTAALLSVFSAGAVLLLKKALNNRIVDFFKNLG